VVGGADPEALRLSWPRAIPAAQGMGACPAAQGPAANIVVRQRGLEYRDDRTSTTEMQTLNVLLRKTITFAWLFCGNAPRRLALLE